MRSFEARTHSGEQNCFGAWSLGNSGISSHLSAKLRSQIGHFRSTLFHQDAGLFSFSIPQFYPQNQGNSRPRHAQ